MDASTIIALAGIGGTLVAALGGIYLGAVLERRAEGRRESLTIRRAARLIDADLLMATTAARICVERKHWWVTDRKLTSEGWREHRDVIAATLPSDGWLAVVVAVEAIGDLQGSRDAARSLQLAQLATDPMTRDALAAADRLGLDIADPAPDITEATAAGIVPMLADLLAGRAALAALATAET